MRILIHFKRLNVIKGGRGTEMWASLFSDQKKLDAACFRTVKLIQTQDPVRGFFCSHKPHLTDTSAEFLYLSFSVLCRL